MEALPDDALLAVLHRLDNGDLVRCRRVCRRLRDVVGHPELWRDRDISGGFLLMSPPPPRCRRLALTGWRKLPVGSATAVRTTSCAAAGLSILVDAHPLVAAGVIRRQAELGRLTELDISFSPACWRAGEGLLLRSALQVGGLRELHIGSSKHSYTTGWSSPVPPSLKKLAYGGDDAALLKVLLRAHAATLEEVWLDHRGSWGDEVVDLLASIAHPWELQCPFVPGLDKLAKCRSLTSLRLTAQDRVNPPYIADAKKFLRLSSISRFYVKGMGEMVVDLVKTLGETGSPKLTRVEVDLLAEIEISRVVADVINQMPVYSAQKTEVLKHCDYLPSLKELIIGGERVLLTPRD
ncbi:uncharacterized protein LOC113215023 isoform X2 [Frankliniella occidentalis]|uniref:Uncharacterized protein LOC113215023 isoform X2 n=1 Tax=Frankliniella occidentalis TaxID=133901 RepID=A0A9C6XUQ1_FRAOC|nr:uncharacterized protein LOC113215023 isoform X2 [Frankliniella occidentalis]